MAFQRFLSFYSDQTGPVWSWSRQQTPVISHSRRRRQEVTDRGGESAVWRSDPHKQLCAGFIQNVDPGIYVKSAEGGFFGLAAPLKRACAADPALCPLHFPCKSAPHSPSLCRSQQPEACSESAPLINRHETIAGRVIPLSTMGRRSTGFTGFTGSLPPRSPAAPGQDVHSGLQLQLDSWNAAKPETQQPLRAIASHTSPA